MALPELYRYGRGGKWFSQRQFFVYMLDAVYQVHIPNFLIFIMMLTEDSFAVRNNLFHHPIRVRVPDSSH